MAMAAMPAMAALAMGLFSRLPPPCWLLVDDPKASTTDGPDELLEDARLALLGAGGHRRQLSGVLVSVVDAVSIEIGDALGVRLLLDVAAEFQPLLGRQPFECLARRVLVLVWRQRRSHLPIPVDRLLVADATPGRALLVPPGEILESLALVAAEQSLRQTPWSCPPSVAAPLRGDVTSGASPGMVACRAYGDASVGVGRYLNRLAASRRVLPAVGRGLLGRHGLGRMKAPPGHPQAACTRRSTPGHRLSLVGAGLHDARRHAVHRPSDARVRPGPRGDRLQQVGHDQRHTGGHAPRGPRPGHRPSVARTASPPRASAPAEPGGSSSARTLRSPSSSSATGCAGVPPSTTSPWAGARSSTMRAARPRCTGTPKGVPMRCRPDARTWAASSPSTRPSGVWDCPCHGSRFDLGGPRPRRTSGRAPRIRGSRGLSQYAPSANPLWLVGGGLALGEFADPAHLAPRWDARPLSPRTHVDRCPCSSPGPACEIDAGLLRRGHPQEDRI